MYFLTRDRKGSATKQIDIHSVIDDLLVINNRHFCLVIETSSVNFELKSEDEQDVLIETYRSFINSLGFPLQLVIRTREVDLDSYLDKLKHSAEKETVAIYQEQLADYACFVRSLVNVNRILSRNFYIILPHKSLQPIDSTTAKDQLLIKADIINKGLQRLGMNSRLITGLEALNLFYAFYNPELYKSAPISSAALNGLHAAILRGDLCS